DEEIVQMCQGMNYLELENLIATSERIHNICYGIHNEQKILKSSLMRELVTYTYPPEFDYQSLEFTMLAEVNIKNITAWLTNQAVRINLLNNLLLTVGGTYFPPGNSVLEHVPVFHSPFMGEYMRYI